MSMTTKLTRWTTFWMAAIAIAPAALLAQRDRDRERERDRDREQEYRTRIDTTFNFSRTGIIDLSVVSGEIVVSGWSRDEVKVHAYSERGRLDMGLSSSHLSLEAHANSGRMGDTRYEV